MITLLAAKHVMIVVTAIGMPSFERMRAPLALPTTGWGASPLKPYEEKKM